MQELELSIEYPELTGLFYSTHQQFDRLQKLCAFLEKAISKEAKRRDAHGQRQLKGIKDEVEQEFRSVDIDDSLFEIKRDFPRIVRYSLFVSMMSTTEACLVRLCRVAHRRLEITDEFNEKGSDVIQRALEYLHSKASLDTSRMCYYKELADSLRNLRNAITHSEGYITGRVDEEPIRAYCTEATTATIDERNNIVLSDRFVTNNAHGMRRLIIQLHGKLKKKIGVHITRSCVIAKSGQ